MEMGMRPHGALPRYLGNSGWRAGEAQQQVRTDQDAIIYFRRYQYSPIPLIVSPPLFLPIRRTLGTYTICVGSLQNKRR